MPTKLTMPMAYPAPRVSQLDGHILDTELNDLLIDQLKDCLKLLPQWRFLFSQHLDLYTLLVKLVVFRLTVGRKALSYGLQLQNLKLSDGNTTRPIGFNKKFGLFLLIIAEYLYKKVAAYLYRFDNEGEVEGVGAWADFKRFLVRHNKVLLKYSENLLKVLNLVNFILFLTDGKHINLVYRVMGITLTPIISDLLKFNGNNVNFEFQNRQLAWNVMTEFLVFLMPLLQLNKLRNMVRRLLRPRGRKGKQQGTKVTPFTNLPINQCAICHQNNMMAQQSGQSRLESIGEITNAYETNCGHIYCYICLAAKFNSMEIRGSAERCLRCGEELKWFKEYGVDEPAGDDAVDPDAILYGEQVEDLDDEVDWKDENHNPDYMPRVVESYTALASSEDSEYDSQADEIGISEDFEVDEEMEDEDMDDEYFEEF